MRIPLFQKQSWINFANKLAAGDGASGCDQLEVLAERQPRRRV
ncbi:MAG TPA: hypothetical protein VLW54_07580 [Candidatus Acidoferrales bacterium]|nr:hypothetical protein [Candidatus Acidoferrales bacterium]